MRVDSIWIRGYGYADTDTPIRIRGYGYADRDTRIWTHGYGYADTHLPVGIHFARGFYFCRWNKIALARFAGGEPLGTTTHLEAMELLTYLNVIL